MIGAVEILIDWAVTHWRALLAPASMIALVAMWVGCLIAFCVSLVVRR